MLKKATDFLLDKQGRLTQDLLVLALMFGFAFFQFLGKTPLLEPDEGRYAEIPREMLERGDFITPLLNYVKYFEKPPLHYWLNALSFSVFGQNEFAARFPAALFGVLTVLSSYYVARKLFGRREGIFSALILGTSIGFIAQARINITDMTLTCCLTATLGFLAIAVREGEVRRVLYCALAGIFAGLAVLAKGLIGIVFPGAILFFFLLLTWRWRLLREKGIWVGILACFLVATPWFVLVSLKNPEFPRFFFIHEHFERFLTRVHGRYAPPWFFIPVLFGCMIPWSFFIPAALRRVWKGRQDVDGDARLFLFLWAIIIFLFFSKSNSKLIPYILPVVPPLAMLMGQAYSKSVEGFDRIFKIQAHIGAVVLAVMGAGFIVYPRVVVNPELSPMSGTVLGLLFLVQGLGTFRAITKGSMLLLFATLLLFSYIEVIAAPHLVLPRIAERKSAKDIALVVREKAGSDAVVATLGYVQGMPFYTKRRMVVVGWRDELDFGSRQGNQSAWFMDIPRFIDLWNSSVTVFAVLGEGEFVQLKGMVKRPVFELGRGGRKILVSNSPG